ncbi:hypothetical protein GCM10027081_38730 [Cupriavidus yeoncheonensis]
MRTSVWCSDSLKIRSNRESAGWLAAGPPALEAGSGIDIKGLLKGYRYGIGLLLAQRAQDRSPGGHDKGEPGAQVTANVLWYRFAAHVPAPTHERYAKGVMIPQRRNVMPAPTTGHPGLDGSIEPPYKSH